MAVAVAMQAREGAQAAVVPVGAQLVVAVGVSLLVVAGAALLVVVGAGGGGTAGLIVAG